MREVLEVIWGAWEWKYFCEGDSTALSTKGPTGKSPDGVDGSVWIDIKAMTHSMLNRRVRATISDRQFYQQLAIAGIITQDEALAANAAVIPPPLLDIVDKMPADQQFSIKMIVSGATVLSAKIP